MILLATVVAVWLLWLADRWGLGPGGELLFAVCLVGGGAWLADKYFAFLGVLIFLVARRIVPQVSEIPSAGTGEGRVAPRDELATLKSLRSFRSDSL